MSTTGSARVRGVTLAYERTTSPATDMAAVAGAPELIWGHGLSMNMAADTELALLDWSQIPVALLRYDARGHGLSEQTAELAGYSWASLAADQLALADALGIGRYVAAGASMGCGTALHVAVQAPERVRGLVLVIPPTAWETRAAQAEQWMASAQIIETRGVEALIAARALMPPPDPYVGDDARRERQAAATRAWDPARLAHIMRGATTANLPDRAAVAAITAPTLILAWTGDAVHPSTTSDELAALLPHAQYHLASTRSEVEGWSTCVAAFVSALE